MAKPDKDTDESLHIPSLQETVEYIRRQIWFMLLVAAVMTVYIAFRYQYQNDLIHLDEKEKELQDVKYRALSSSSDLTERCRESHILETLKAMNDTTIAPADQPPYLIEADE